MQQNKTLIGIGAALFIAVVLYFIFTNGAGDVGKTERTTSTDDGSAVDNQILQEETDIEMGEDEVIGDAVSANQTKDSVMTIDMANYSFTPAIIEAAPGDQITVRLTNSGGFHDFVIDELNVKSAQINTGDEALVIIDVPENPGQNEYIFYCSIGNHRQLGMEGVLRISQ